MTIGVGLAAGCGPKPRPVDPCADKTCAYGVCDSDSGQCVSADQCSPIEADSDAGMSADAGAADASGAQKLSECVEGYSCVDGSCEADTTCETDVDCDRGTCSNGACTNRDECEADNDCVDGFVCGEDNSCQRLECLDAGCDRGVCSEEQNGCINRSVCPSPEGEPPACLEDFKCYDESCQDEEAVCDDLDCQRGVCSFDELTCVDAESCTEDSECLEGNYCAEDGTCQENVCETNMETCSGGGVCDPATGDCVNPEQCSDNDACLPMNWCIGNSCVEQTAACGEDGCPGNQECSNDEENLSASCAENMEEGCSSAVDCLDDRVCQDGSCADPTMCQDDGLEPNNSESEAVSFLDNKQDGAVAANICSGDTDVFTYDTAEDGDTGTLFVDLAYEPVDVGLGTLQLEVIGPDGNSVATKTADMNTAGQISIEDQFMIGQSGSYTFKVSDTGDVNTAGVRYKLTADIVDRQVINACMNSSQLMPTTSGNTLSGSSVPVDASCISGGDQAAEDIYTFTLQNESYVEIDVAPMADADISASIRSKCARPDSEEVCVNSGSGGDDESIAKPLPAGQYFLIVQAPTQGAGGNYEITYSASEITCSSADNTCVDANNAKICNDRGTQLEDVACDMGCDMMRGVCNRPAADACYTAVDATGGMESTEITWGDLQDDLDPGAMTCLGESMPNSDGPDAIYRVDLADGEAMKATLTLSSGQDGSLYLLDQCGSAAQSCQKGAEGSGEAISISQENQSGTDQTFFVVADTADGTTGTADIEIDAGQVVCMTGDKTCQSGNVATCNDVGTGYDVSAQCPSGCMNAACTGDTCSANINAGSGGTYSFDITQFNGDYDISDSACAGDALPANDVVFSVTAQADQVIEASVTPQNSTDDPAIYIVEDCMSTQTHTNTCLAGSDANFGGDTDTAVAQVGAAGTYFVVVDGDDTGQASGTWDVDIQTKSTVCTIGDTQCKDSTTLQYCDNNGLTYTDYSCQGMNPSCTTSGGSASCNNPTGSQCFDAIPVQSGDSKTGGWSGSNNIEIDDDRQIGQCFLDDFTDSAETIYSIDLQQGDLLTATLTTQFSDAMMYVLQDCYDKNTCGANLPSEGPGQLQYLAGQSETVYVVVDGNLSSNSSDPYTVDFNVQSGKTCVPGTSSCTNQTTVGTCDSTGSGFASTRSCTNSCQNGACQFPTSSVQNCAMAPDVGSGTYTTGSFADFSNDSNLTGGSCAGSEDSDGPDSAYKVQLQQDEVLHATLEGSGFDDPILYAVTDCSMLDSSCVAGDTVRSSGGTAEIFYKASSATTLFVVADSTSNDDSPFKLTIDVTSTQCSPGTVQCGMQGQDLMSCNQYGLWESVACNGGCSSGQCANPAGDVCFDPIRLQSGDSVTHSWGSTNSVQIESNREGGCFVDNLDTTHGPEKIYSVNVPAGNLLEAKLSNASSDAMLSIQEDCTDTSTCVTNNAGGGDTTEYYYATSGTTVSVIVDSIDQAPTGQFTLDVTVRSNASCPPGDTLCAGGNTVGICNSDGTSLVGQYNCSNGCSAGACQAPMGADKCASAPTVGGGYTAYHDYSQLTNDVAITSSASCVGDDGDGNEVVYKVQVNAQEVLHAEAYSEGNEDPLVYIVGDCTMPDSTCLGASTSSDGFSEAYFAAQSSQTVYVVADTTFSSNDEPFEMRIDTQPVECQSGQRQCTSGGQNVRFCNSYGLWEQFQCQSGGCSSGFCNNPSADRCLDPQLLSDGSSVTSSWGQVDDIEMTQSQHGGCFLDSFTSTDGPEKVYAVQLSSGDMLEAKLETQETQAMLGIYTDCTNVDSCVANNPSEGATTQYYHASNTETVYVVVDATTTSPSGQFTLTTNITSGRSCAAGDTVCTSSNQVGICNGVGTGFIGQYSCANGCANGACTTSSAADTCSSAPTVGGGFTGYHVWGDLTDDVAITSSASCVDEDGDGSEAVYEVQMGANEVLHATGRAFEAFEDPLVYIVEDCTMPDSSCLAGGGNDDGFSEAYYTSSQAKTVYVVVDSDSSFDSGAFEVRIDKRAQQCTPGNSQCNSAGTDLQVCNQYGLYDSYPCNGGCSSGSCGNPRGDACFDAKPLTSGDSVTGDFGGSNRLDIRSNRFGGCFQDNIDRTEGADTFYSVSLNAGETLEADLSTGVSSATLGIFTDCSNQDTCQANNPDGGATTQYYHADSQETVYLVVDALSDTASGQYTLDVDVTTSTCAPGDTACVSSSQVGICNETGSAYTGQYNCSAGCSNGACGEPMGADTCASAPSIGSGITVYSDFAQGTDDVSITSSASCIGDDGDGNDKVYQVTVGANEVLRAESTSWGNEAPLLYVVTDCTQPDMTCQAGAEDDAGRAELTYAPQQQETVYVVADSTSSSYDEPYELRIEKVAKQCTPGAKQCAGSDLRYCNDNGLWEYYACQGGCSSGACQTPTGDVCYDTKTLPSNGQVTIDATTLSNDYDLDSSACTGDDTPGPEVAYQVQVPAGEVLQAKVTPQNSTDDPAVYVVDACGSASTVEGACVSGADENEAGGSETVHVASSMSAKTYWVVVDADDPTEATGKWDLSVKVTAPECSPMSYTPICTGPNEIRVCNQYELYEKENCPPGCTNGTCPTGQTCTQSITLTNGDSDTQTFSGTQAISVPTGTQGMCNFTSSNQPTGPDHIYRIQLQAGQTLSVDYDAGVNESPSSFGVMYLLGTCGQVSSCLTNTSSTLPTSGQTGALTYQASQAETVYLVVARNLSSGTTSYDYRVTANIQ